MFPLWIYWANILDVSKHTPKSVQLFALPCCCMVTGSRRHGTWILMNYTRSLGKQSRFQQHLVSCVSMIDHRIQYLGRQMQHVWRPRRESFDNIAVHGGVTVRDFIVIRWINNEFSSDSVPIHLWVECAFNSHRPKLNCERKVWTRPMHIQCVLNSVLVSNVKRPLHFWTKAFSSCGVVCSLQILL